MSIFIHYEGIKGKVSDANYKEWVDALELSWGVNRPITSHTSTRGDRESGNAKSSDLNIVRYMDKASVALFTHACCGTGKTAKVVQTKTGTGNGAHGFIEYTLHNALITRYHVKAISDSVARPLEEITISFVDMDMKYTSYDEDGNPEAPIAVGFNTATNTKK